MSLLFLVGEQGERHPPLTDTHHDLLLLFILNNVPPNINYQHGDYQLLPASDPPGVALLQRSRKQNHPHLVPRSANGWSTAIGWRRIGQIQSQSFQGSAHSALHARRAHGDLCIVK